MTARLALCAALAACAALPATAQVHRWVDEQGRVHYGDRPMGGSGTTLRIRAESATAPSAPPAAAPTGQPSPMSARQAPAPAKPAAATSPPVIDRMLAQQQQQQRAVSIGPKPAPTAQSPGMAALIAQCKANRGVDCDTPQGMRTLQQENTPITREEQSRIAGLRARRASCARVPGTLGC